MKCYIKINQDGYLYSKKVGYQKQYNSIYSKWIKGIRKMQKEGLDCESTGDIAIPRNKIG
jgi:hypothetical protein